MHSAVLGVIDPDRLLRRRMPGEPDVQGVRGWATAGDGRPNEAPWAHLDLLGLRDILARRLLTACATTCVSRHSEATTKPTRWASLFAMPPTACHATGSRPRRSARARARHARSRCGMRVQTTDARSEASAPWAASASPAPDNRKMEWGSVAEIVAAACTIVTVVGSVLLAVQQIGERRAAQALLESERDRARRSDAESVMAWVETRTSPKGKQTAVLHVLNSSPRPVFAAYIVPTTYWKRHTSAPILCDVLAPGIDVPEDFTEEAKGLVAGEEGNLDIAQRVGVRIRFRDSAGQSWERTIDGRLHEHENNPADFDFNFTEPLRGATSPGALAE